MYPLVNDDQSVTFIEQDLPLHPAVTVLRMGVSTLDPDQTASTIHIASVASLLSEPQLECLAVANVIVTSHTPAQDELALEPPSPPALIPELAASNVAALELSNVAIGRSTLENLLHHMKPLTSFRLVRGHLNLPIINASNAPEDRRTFTLRHLRGTLKQIQNSVEHVGIGYGSCQRCIEAGHLDFSECTKLTTLIVGSSIILGRRICRDDMSASRANIDLRHPFSLASLLPESLEELTIVIDLEQAARIPGYRQYMLQSILRNEAQLRQLLKVSFREPRLTQGHAKCMCGWTSSKENIRPDCPAPMCGWKIGKVGQRFTGPELYLPEEPHFQSMADEYAPLCAREATHLASYKKKLAMIGIDFTFHGEQNADIIAIANGGGPYKTGKLKEKV